MAIVAGTSSARPKIKITLSNGATIESGEITLASTTVYGVTKLSSATNSTVENLAATPKAVKTAYDLASTANSNANNANSTAQSAAELINKLLEMLNSQILRVVILSDVTLEPKNTTTIDLKNAGVNAMNIVNAIAFNGNKENLMAIIREGVSFSMKDTVLYISSTVSAVVTVKVLYNYNFVLK
ncbi:phage tail protein [Bacteroidales bacterium OttesenSCG-928-B11]|nr:phage tail protein [Bacteroidales bacterium OttesenSCG-928-C03]MDL2313110.1 phage tail protein [Bacteroidales bacterium OttesenSCG-928-B11]